MYNIYVNIKYIIIRVDYDSLIAKKLLFCTNQHLFIQS